MKKLLSCILTVILSLTCFTACNNGTSSEPKDISCEDIIKAYEDAGYYVTHGEHKDDESSRICFIKINLTEDSDSDYIYFQTYFTEEQAKEAAKVDEYDPAIWFFAAVVGENRWLKSGTYGKIEYSYYNSELIKPFNELIK